MEPERNLTPIPPIQRDEEKRNKGRLVCDFLTCELGPVVDLSASGMRVRYKGEPGFTTGESLEVVLRALNERAVVKAEITWVRQVNFEDYEIGLKFLDVNPTVGEALLAVARVAMSHYSGITSTPQSPIEQNND